MMNFQTGYIDPSVMTYAIQAIAGVVVAVGAVVIVFWRRAKKKVSDKLGIEERQKKEQEEGIQVTADLDEITADAAPVVEVATEEKAE